MFHLSVKPISRAAGRSATAAAAYRSGQLIVDERTGEVHDYSRKSDVVHSEILVPPGAPAWAEDRTALWNAAEAAEKRKDARVARDYEVAIPKELTREEGIELVRDFSQGLADRYGVAVDFNVHRDELRNWDGSEKGYQGYHAHVLTSTRKLGRDGFGDKAEIELSDTKRKSLGLGDGAGEIDKIRQLWEVAANRHLEQASQAQRIDRRSLKDQGIDRDPTVHLGPHVTALERDGIPSRLGDINRQAAAEHRTRLEDQRILGQLQAEVEPKGAQTPETQTPKHAAIEIQIEQAHPEIPLVGRKAIADLAKERDLRVQRVLAKAEEREERRSKAYQALQGRPAGEHRGALAALSQRTQEQASAALERARKAAARLVEQAKRLTERLIEASGLRRLVAWSHDVLQRYRPDLIAGPEQQATLGRENESESAVHSKEPRGATRPSSVAKERDQAHEPGRGGSSAGSRPDEGIKAPPRASDAGKSAADDLKAQAAEGVAAFRARFEKTRNLEPAKTSVDQALERLKAAAEARREQEASAKKRKENDRGHGLDQPRRDRSKDGPDFER